jgi:2-methylisocitrate lyase-like PEP mutase family enzyme
MKSKADIANLITALNCPVNVLALPGIPDFKSLREIGVARLSLGPGFLKVALSAMKDLAVKLQNHQGLDEVIDVAITSAELKNLVASGRAPVA